MEELFRKKKNCLKIPTSSSENKSFQIENHLLLTKEELKKSLSKLESEYNKEEVAAINTPRPSQRKGLRSVIKNY